MDINIVLFSISGLAAAESILDTMKVTQINMTNNTKFAILKGMSRQPDLNNFEKTIIKYGFKLNEYQLLEIIYEVACNNANWLPKVERYVIFNKSNK